jgi:hypothetical protein
MYTVCREILQERETIAGCTESTHGREILQERHTIAGCTESMYTCGRDQRDTLATAGERHHAGCTESTEYTRGRRDTAGETDL